MPDNRTAAGGRPATGQGRRSVRRKVFSQNFLINQRVIEELVEDSGAAPGDLVLDIGAGNGLITQALARRGARVTAIEYDAALVRRLRTRFGPGSGVSVVAGDVLTAPLPGEPFTVVANIPFAITTKILRRLLDDPAGLLQRADVIVQSEVARKRGTPGRGTLLNACWEPWFEFTAGPRVPRTAFRPQPRVDAAVLTVRRRDRPLIDPALRREYTGFVTAAFTAARPTVASAVSQPLPGARAVPRARYAAIAAELGIPAEALPPHLKAAQWVGLFLAAHGARRAGGARGATAPGRPRRAGGQPVAGRP
jgi:23S rRNA (adenine-N6)-dimethyltransferase